MDSGAGPKPRLIGRFAPGRASSINNHCLSAHLQCAIPVGMPASGLEDRIGMGWESEQYFLGAI